MKGIKNLKKEEHVEMLKLLNYVSQINKSKKEMQLLFRKKMSSTEIKFIEENGKKDITFKDFIFNGIPVPTLEIKDIGPFGFTAF